VFTKARYGPLCWASPNPPALINNLSLAWVFLTSSTHGILNKAILSFLTVIVLLFPVLLFFYENGAVLLKFTSQFDIPHFFLASFWPSVRTPVTHLRTLRVTPVCRGTTLGNRSSVLCSFYNNYEAVYGINGEGEIRLHFFPMRK
jgi:hypothetical protein